MAEGFSLTPKARAVLTNDQIDLKGDVQSSKFVSSHSTYLNTPIPPNSDDSSAISLLSRDCLKRFRYICNILQDLEPSQAEDEILGYDTRLALLAMQDACVRFKAWGESIAAFHDGCVRTSLDFRLREAPEIRGRALQILEYLQEYLHEATLIFSGEKPNASLDSGSMSESSDESEEEDEGKGDEEVHIEDYQKQKNAYDEVDETSELQEIFTAIVASNKSLMKLSMVIRSSPARDDYIKAASRYKDWNPYADIGHVREKHGSAKGGTDWLLTRLGNAIARRRQFLKYRVEHSEKMAGGWDEGEKPRKEDEKPEKTIASTEATTFMGNDNVYQRDGSDKAGSFGSQTSYEQTVLGDETAATKLTVPPPPKFAFPDVLFEYGEPFNCPYCYTEQNVKNKAAWKKHVFLDLKPYICTFKECSMMMFRSRHEWFAHELQNHRREWVCQYCQHVPFQTAPNFSKHISSSHPAVLAGTQIEAMLLQSEEAVDTISAFACPLCDEWEESVTSRQEKQEEKIRMLNDGEMVEPYGTRRQFRRHLGRHMEQLALFALPPNDAELDDDSTEGKEDEDEDHADDVYISYFDMPGRGSLELRYKASQDPYDAAARFFAQHKLPVTQPAIDEVAAWIKQRLQAYGGISSAKDPASAYPLSGDGIRDPDSGIIRPFFRPEWIRELPNIFPTEQKVKWENELRRMWKLVDENEVTTQTHLDAKRQLYDFSISLYAKLRAERVLQGEYGHSVAQAEDIDHPDVPSRSQSMNQFTDPNNTTVFVGGFSGYVTEDELRSFFEGFGEITYVKIPPGKGCGFIQFVQRRSAEMAIDQMQGYPIGKSRVRLSWGRSQNDSGPAGTLYRSASPSPYPYWNSEEAPTAPRQSLSTESISIPVLPSISLRDTADISHEESLERSRQKEEGGNKEFQTAAEEAKKRTEEDAERKEKVEEEIARNLAWFKEAGQRTARPAAAAMAELDPTKTEFYAGTRSSDLHFQSLDNLPEDGPPSTRGLEVSTAGDRAQEAWQILDQSPQPGYDSDESNVSVGSWIRDEINITGTSPFPYQSPSYDSSSYLPKLEANFMRDFACCGQTLPTLHDLLQHYEKVHAQEMPQSLRKASAAARMTESSNPNSLSATADGAVIDRIGPAEQGTPPLNTQMSTEEKAAQMKRAEQEIAQNFAILKEAGLKVAEPTGVEPPAKAARTTELESTEKQKARREGHRLKRQFAGEAKSKADVESESSVGRDAKGKAKQLPERSGAITGVRCATCAANGDEVWVIPGRFCAYCRTRTRLIEDPKLAESEDMALENKQDDSEEEYGQRLEEGSKELEKQQDEVMEFAMAKFLQKTRKGQEEAGIKSASEAALKAADIAENVKKEVAEEAEKLEKEATVTAKAKTKADEKKAASTAGGGRSGSITGVRCPTCAANGQEVWIIPGRSCADCGTAC